MDTRWNMHPNKEKALLFAKRELPELVCDAVNLEGINYTLPEIQTLLQGITVGGHKLSDQQVALNQAKAWRFLFDLVEKDCFYASAARAMRIHEIAAEGEALDPGYFRSGSVTISGTDYMPPPAEELPRRFEKMVEEARPAPDVYDRATYIFLIMARTQFFWDVNKRTGRFMMNGLLLQAGYPSINVQASRQLEFNQLMLEYYESGDQMQMTEFLRSCLDPRVIKIFQEET